MRLEAGLMTAFVSFATLLLLPFNGYGSADAFLLFPGRSSSSALLPLRTELCLLKAAAKNSPQFEEKEFNIDDILAEADEALKAADEALSKGTEESKVPEEAEGEEEREEANGEINDEGLSTFATEAPSPKPVSIKSIRDAKEEPVTAEVKAALSALEKRQAKEERRKKEAALEGVNEVVERGVRNLGGVLTNMLEGTVNSAKVSMSRQVGTTVEDMKQVPSKIRESASKRAKETADEIANIPTMITKATQKKVNDISSLPNKLLNSAKRGFADIPTLENWRQNANGSITGEIGGSLNGNYENGETITTAVVRQEASEGGMIETASGTKYYLGAKAQVKEQPLDLMGLFFGDGEKKTSQPKPKDKVQRARQAADEKRKEAEEMREAAQRARAAMDSLKEAQPRATFSLAALFGGEGFLLGSVVGGAKNKPRPPEPMASPPRGVPIITKWRQNSDGSISGLISGSSAFEEGEAVTTSPITGDAIGMALVTTETGSRYYLTDKKSGGDGLFGAFGMLFAPFKKD